MFNRGFVLTGAVFVILIIGMASANYLLVSQRNYETGVSQVMSIDAVLNAYQDMKGVIALNSENILLDCVKEVVADGCAMSSSALENMIEDRIDAAFQDFNDILSDAGIQVNKGAIGVDASVSGGKTCRARADIELELTVKTSDGSVKKTGHLGASHSAP